METDPVDIEALGIREQHEQGSGSSDEEGFVYNKRKRPQDGSPAPLEYMRSGKRPSLTPSPLSSLPPPGMMNPDDVTIQDLSQIVVFQDDKAMMLTVCWRGKTRSIHMSCPLVCTKD
jgi:hypothetical protein